MYSSSTSGMFKIVRPAVGEAIRWLYNLIQSFWLTAHLCDVIIKLLFLSSREMPLSELRSKYRKISSLEKARTGWEDEYEISSRQVNWNLIEFTLLVALTIYWHSLSISRPPLSLCVCARALVFSGCCHRARVCGGASFMECGASESVS